VELRYSFEWDPTKARQNIRKHTISFERAATVFRDPNQISIYNQEHSNDEDRWITLGLSQDGTLLVVVHTFSQTSQSNAGIRIISARRATRAEVRHYEEFGI
jgi:uncharacterized DUF497 family protein